MSKIRIFLDSDGVLTNWNKQACKLFNIDPKSINQYDFDKLVKREVLLEKIEKEGIDFWSNLEVFPWAYELIDLCKKIGDLSILTSPGEWHHAPTGKMIHFKKHFKNTSFIITKDKHLCAQKSSILIDDTEKNIEKFKSYGGNGILFPNQKDIENGKIKVSDFYKKIKEQADIILKSLDS